MSKITWVFLTIFLYATGYYSWLIYFQNQSFVLTAGGNLFSLAGLLFALYLLYPPLRKNQGTDRIFWMCLFTGVASYLVAELIWFVTETILRHDVAYPGWPDVFYLLQVFCIIFALAIQIFNKVKLQERISVFFDTLILTVVTSTFSWHYLIEPILSDTHATKLALAVSLSYPIGDLSILAMTIFLLLRTPQRNRRVLIVIATAMIIQAIADTIYLYLTSLSNYASGNLVDPLFIFAMMMMGAAGAMQDERIDDQRRSPVEKQTLLQMFSPYVGVVILFAFMSVHSEGFDVVRIGSGISIVLVIIRQIWIILENQRLLKMYSIQTRELEMSQERYKSLFEYHPDSVYSTDMDGRFDSVNQACSSLLQTAPERLIGQSSLAFVSKDSRSSVIAETRHVFNGEPRNYDARVVISKNETAFVNITNVPIIVQDEMVGVFGIGKDVTALREQELKIHQLAYFDHLTGLSNRVSFEERLIGHFKGQTKHSPGRFALFFLDLNQFKTVNDTLGHDVGDQLLTAVAERLKSLHSVFSHIARQGGDEFTLMLTGYDTSDTVKHAAETVNELLRKPYTINDRIIHCPPSIGISCYPEDAKNEIEMMKHADIAMYEAKQISGGAYLFYDHLISKRT